MKRRKFVALLRGEAARVAARNAGAGSGQAADHWKPWCDDAFCDESPGRNACAAAARTWLDREPHYRANGRPERAAKIDPAEFVQLKANIIVALGAAAVAATK